MQALSGHRPQLDPAHGRFEQTDQDADHENAQGHDVGAKRTRRHLVWRMFRRWKRGQDLFIRAARQFQCGRCRSMKAWTNAPPEASRKRFLGSSMSWPWPRGPSALTRTPAVAGRLIPNDGKQTEVQLILRPVRRYTTSPGRCSGTAHRPVHRDSRLAIHQIFRPSDLPTATGRLHFGHLANEKRPLRGVVQRSGGGAGVFHTARFGAAGEPSAEAYP